MIELNDWMYRHPEPGFEEFGAARKLADELQSHGFKVEMGVPRLEDVWPEFDRLKYSCGLSKNYNGTPGLPTAFKAKYRDKTESPVIGIVVEYDALRGDPPFHGCQHNMQGPTGIGAGIALAKVMERHNLPGSIWIIGAPGEEVSPPSKAAMVKAGYIDGIDFGLRTHGVDHKNETVVCPGGFSPRHIEQLKYTFHGKSAHGQRAWEGISALDGVMLLFHAMEIMREHSEPQFRFHGVVTDGGVAPNIVAERASAAIWIRHFIDETPLGSMTPRQANEMIKAKVEQMHNAARGAALATGTTVEIEHTGSCVPSIHVGAFQELGFEYALAYGAINVKKEAHSLRHFEETGLMSLKMPGLRVQMGIEGVPTAVGHSHHKADVSATPAGHQALITLAKVMGAVGLRLVMDSDIREKIEREHADLRKQYDE